MSGLRFSPFRGEGRWCSVFLAGCSVTQAEDSVAIMWEKRIRIVTLLLCIRNLSNWKNHFLHNGRLDLLISCTITHIFIRFVIISTSPRHWTWITQNIRGTAVILSQELSQITAIKIPTKISTYTVLGIWHSSPCHDLKHVRVFSPVTELVLTLGPSTIFHQPEKLVMGTRSRTESSVMSISLDVPKVWPRRGHFSCRHSIAQSKVP